MPVARHFFLSVEAGQVNGTIGSNDRFSINLNFMLQIFALTLILVFTVIESYIRQWSIEMKLYVK